MNDGATFLVQTLFDLYLMAIILRIWMQLVQADYYNPLAQFIAKITNPPLNLFRRIIPATGKLDLAAVVLAIVLNTLKLYLLIQLTGWGGQPGVAEVLIISVHNLIIQTLQLMFWILIIRAILSWFSQGRSPVEYIMMQLTEPMLAPIRRIIPPMGGLDLSVLILIILIQFVRVALS